MDGRQALTPGEKLTLHTQTGYMGYTISREIGRGGSSIVYDASYTDNLGNSKLVRIKECYPHALRLKRQADSTLAAAQRDTAAFETAKSRMISAYQKNHALFMHDRLTNTVANTSNLYEAHGTIYIVSVYLNGRTFAEDQGTTLHDCVQLILSTAKALQHIHEAGYLYLDLKPDNILTLAGSRDLVQLFDFDSVVSQEELQAAVQSHDPTALRTSYSKGFAPLEQQTGRLNRLGIHSDLYSLGAVLFHALFHCTPTAFDCETDAVFDFAHMTYAGSHFQDRLYRALSAFFHKTLASYYGDRYQHDSEAIAQLQEILALSDETRPWLRSTYLQLVPVFYGREKELSDLAHFMDENTHHTCSLYGMGGIGKSTLVRQYLAMHAGNWDAVLWLYDQDSLTALITDDTQVQLNTVSRLREETGEEYCQRKLQTLGMLAKSQHILMVLDNFDPAHLDQIRMLSPIGITVLLISREKLPEGLFPAFPVGEMQDAALLQMFAHYAHCDMHDPGNQVCFAAIMDAIDRHTLLTELIARQIDRSYLDLKTAEAMVSGIGLARLSQEKIDYIHDQTVCRGTLLKILDRLVEIDHFSPQDRILMKLLSLFRAPGIEAGLFRHLTDCPRLDLISSLETAGWLKRDGKWLYMHPLMQEYIRSWPWLPETVQAADRMMLTMYGMLLPAGKRPDTERQFPEDPVRFYGLLQLAHQMTAGFGLATAASQQLLYRWLMDAPVDQDTEALFCMLDMLHSPVYLDDDQILRLYETAAYYRARLYMPDDALRILQAMKKYLRQHPSAYYLSAYHRAMAVILHNAGRDEQACLRHEDRAIAAARLSRHPEARKQLAACLMEKARTLMSAETDQRQVRRLLQEAGALIPQCTEAQDYERYQYACNAAMCHAMDGETQQALQQLEAATAIACASPDSDLAIAEHLIEEAAPIRIALQHWEAAEAAVREAIALCEKHPEALRYRETVFDAFLFLGRIYDMHGQPMQAEDAFQEAEKRVQDSPYVWKLPLCPEEIRKKAAEARKRTANTSDRNGSSGHAV